MSARAAAVAAGLLSAAYAVGIGPGAQAVTAPPAQSAATLPEAPDAVLLYPQIARVAQQQRLQGLQIADDIVASLAAGAAAEAVDALEAQAGQGNRDANVALVRVQHWCAQSMPAPAPNDPARLARLGSALSPERAARVTTVLNAATAHLQKTKSECAAARFNFGAIESRLRQGAAGGDPVSTTALSQFTRDPAQREKYLSDAAAKGYAPAQHALAVQRLTAVQRGERTEGVATIRTLLKQAGQTLPRAKLDFANCAALGCDGHPADTSTAGVFGLDAVRDGEPGAFPAVMRMPWRGRMPPEQLLAWQYFGDRLNENGCMGDAYVNAALGFSEAIRQLEQAFKPPVVAQARDISERYWKEFGARARREQGCREG